MTDALRRARFLHYTGRRTFLNQLMRSPCSKHSRRCSAKARLNHSPLFPVLLSDAGSRNDANSPAGPRLSPSRRPYGDPPEQVKRQKPRRHLPSRAANLRRNAGYPWKLETRRRAPEGKTRFTLQARPELMHASRTWVSRLQPTRHRCWASPLQAKTPWPPRPVPVKPPRS